GFDELVVLPLPNSPELFAPQHFTLPLGSNAHEWDPPAAIAGVTVRAPARSATAAAGTAAHTSPAAINNKATPIRRIMTPPPACVGAPPSVLVLTEQAKAPERE